MKPINVGMLGLGTVGAGTMNVLSRNQDEIFRRAGRDIHVSKAVVTSLDKSRDCDVSQLTLTTNPDDLIHDQSIDVIVEVMGGEEAALKHVLSAIAAGKHIVTANKALIAKHGNEIFQAALKKGVIVAFEAAVAGGIPIIKAIREGMAANRIEQLAGIINGTSNYILTEMQQCSADFDDVLKQAQANGFAEADPSFDIDGIDVAHKLTILAAIAFGIPLQFNKVHVEGIRDITLQDIAYAGELGYVIKHLGIAKRTPAGIELRAHPTLVPVEQTIAHVNGVMNAIYVDADALGPSLYYGAGAGAEPTASAVVADLVDVVRSLTVDSDNRVPHLAFQADRLDDVSILEIGKSQTANYLRLLATDKSGVLADITRLLADFDISIESILQKEREQQDGLIPIIIITHSVLEANMLKAIAGIEALTEVHEPIMRIRLDHFK